MLFQFLRLSNSRNVFFAHPKEDLEFARRKFTVVREFRATCDALRLKNARLQCVMSDPTFKASGCDQEIPQVRFGIVDHAMDWNTAFSRVTGMENVRISQARTARDRNEHRRRRRIFAACWAQ
jgi:hypothetical protein